MVELAAVIHGMSDNYEQSRPCNKLFAVEFCCQYLFCSYSVVPPRTAHELEQRLASTRSMLRPSHFFSCCFLTCCCNVVWVFSLDIHGLMLFCSNEIGFDLRHRWKEHQWRATSRDAHGTCTKSFWEGAHRIRNLKRFAASFYNIRGALDFINSAFDIFWCVPPNLWAQSCWRGAHCAARVSDRELASHNVHSPTSAHSMVAIPLGFSWQPRRHEPRLQQAFKSLDFRNGYVFFFFRSALLQHRSNKNTW